MLVNRECFTKFSEGELSTRQPSGNVAANNKSRINRCHPPNYRRPSFPRQAVTGPGWGHCPTLDRAAGPGSPRPAASPARVALTARLPRERPPSPRTERPARPAARLTCRVRGSPPPRPRASAADGDAGLRPSAPCQRSSRRPAAAPSGRKRLRSNRFQLLQTKPPGHPAGRGGRAGGAGPDVTPGALPANRRPRAGVPGCGPCDPGKGPHQRPRLPGIPRVSAIHPTR